MALTLKQRLAGFGGKASQARARSQLRARRAPKTTAKRTTKRAPDPRRLPAPTPSGKGRPVAKNRPVKFNARSLAEQAAGATAGFVAGQIVLDKIGPKINKGAPLTGMTRVGAKAALAFAIGKYGKRIGIPSRIAQAAAIGLGASAGLDGYAIFTARQGASGVRGMGDLRDMRNARAALDMLN